MSCSSSQSSMLSTHTYIVGVLLSIKHNWGKKKYHSYKETSCFWRCKYFSFLKSAPASLEDIAINVLDLLTLFLLLLVSNIRNNKIHMITLCIYYEELLFLVILAMPNALSTGLDWMIWFPRMPSEERRGEESIQTYTLFEMKGWKSILSFHE